MKRNPSQCGFSLVGALVGLGLTIVLLLVISLFQRNLFFFNSVLQGGLNEQFSARKLGKDMVKEIRAVASQSSTGAYPIATAATSTFVFYVDTDADGVIERVRYTLEGTELVRGVVVPTGDPLVYDLGSEATTTFMTDVVNGTESPPVAVFEYFDASYNGTTLPLDNPVEIQDVRLVQIHLRIDGEPQRPPDPFDIVAQASIRNLKDNL